MSNARLPFDPLSSMRRPFFRPVAYLVASKEASAPEASFAVKTTASSTVTVPVPCPAPTCGRWPTKVALIALTPVISSPVR